MDAVELVYDIAQQVAAHHPVLHAAKHGRDHVAAVVTVGTGECAQVTEQARALLAVRQGCLLVVNEGEKFVAGDAVD